MDFKLERFMSNAFETVGRLFIDGHQVAFTLEDEQRTVKVKGETRIPAGKYEIKLRTVGGHHNKYADKFTFHRGMLWLQDVPGFQYILIHIGNTDKDTEGCILVGSDFHDSNGRMSITGSGEAYKKIYPPIAEALVNGEKVFITIEDRDR